jgi:hypothetical protein
MKANRVAKIALSVFVLAGVLGCGGENPDRSSLTTVTGELEPLIPSCSACQYKKAFIGSTGTVSGTFTNVSPSYLRTDVYFGSVAPAVGVPLPVNSQAYSQLVNASRSVTTATMRFWYRSSTGVEVYMSVNLPVH